jgi:hypothetical protein
MPATLGCGALFFLHGLVFCCLVLIDKALQAFDYFFRTAQRGDFPFLNP